MSYQLINIKSILEDKQILFNLYKEQLKESVLIYPIQFPETVAANWMFICGIKKPYSFIKHFMNSRNIDIRPFFYDIYTHIHLDGIEKQNEIETNIRNEIIILPSYPELTEEDQNKIIETIYNYNLLNNTGKSLE